MNTRQTLAAAVLAVAMAAGLTPAAAEFPEKPIQVIVPTQQGGSTDVIARIFQDAIQRKGLLSQPLAVVNVPGAGGTVGTRQIKDAAADCYTVGVWHTGLLTAAAMGVTDFDHTAFEIVGATGAIPLGLAVKEPGRFKSIQDVIGEAKAKPDSVKIATNIGLTVHFVPLIFQDLAGVKMRFVQAGGGSKRLQSVLGEHTDIALFSTQEFVSYGPSGLKAVVVFTEKRHPKFPELPTAKELGYDVVWSEVFLWLAPKGSPKACVDTLANALSKAMADPEVQKKFSDQAMEAEFKTGAELAPFLDGLRKRVGAVAAEVKAAQQQKQ